MISTHQPWKACAVEGSPLPLDITDFPMELSGSSWCLASADIHSGQNRRPGNWSSVSDSKYPSEYTDLPPDDKFQ